MSLCRELGKTLTELRDKTTDRELQIWYALRNIEHKEAEQAKRIAKVQSDLAQNKGRFTGGI